MAWKSCLQEQGGALTSWSRAGASAGAGAEPAAVGRRAEPNGTGTSRFAMASSTVSLAFARRTKDTVDVATPPYELLCCVDAGAHPALTQMEDSVATAMATYRDALASFREQLGDDHAHTLTTIGSLASLRHASGDEAGAKALMREALEGRRRTLGAGHPHTMVSLWSLAKLERSVPLLEEAHAGFCAALGPEHTYSQQCAQQLAALQAELSAKIEMDELQQAVPSGDISLPVFEPPSEESLTSQASVALTERALKKGGEYVEERGEIEQRLDEEKQRREELSAFAARAKAASPSSPSSPGSPPDAVAD